MKTKLTPGKIVGLLIGIGLAVTSAIWGSSDFLNAPDPLSYKTTNGDVLRVWIDISKSQRNTCVEYEYLVDGKQYKSKMYAFNETTFPFDVSPGQPVKVYYRPSNPELAVLDRKRPTQKMFTALMMMGLFAFGSIVAVFAPDPPWVRKNRSEPPV